MNIYNIDQTTGVYLGTSQADESPLEPGEFLIPAHAVTVAPPVIAAGEQARWTGAAWVVEPIPAPPAPPAPPVPTDAELATAELAKTDAVAVRCFKAGAAFPADWQAYVIALRAIVNGGPGPLPAMPAYPPGT